MSKYTQECREEHNEPPCAPHPASVVLVCLVSYGEDTTTPTSQLFPPTRNPPRTEFQRKQFGASSYPPGTLRALTWTPAAWSETLTGVAYGSPPTLCAWQIGEFHLHPLISGEERWPPPCLSSERLLVDFPSPMALGLVYPLSTLPVHPALTRHLRGKKKKKAKFLPKCTTTCALRCKNLYMCACGDGVGRRSRAKWFISNLSGFTRGFAQSRANG